MSSRSGFVTPELAVALILALALAGLAGWALWERAGRLACEVERVQLADAYQVLAAKVKEQNTAILTWQAKGAQAREAGRQAQIAAEAAAQAQAAEIERLRGLLAGQTPAGQDCRDAWALIRSLVPAP